jgi:hypothetical protein
MGRPPLTRPPCLCVCACLQLGLRMAYFICKSKAPCPEGDRRFQEQPQYNKEVVRRPSRLGGTRWPLILMIT